jgi:flagellar L-ring protein precursor FlgH
LIQKLFAFILCVNLLANTSLTFGDSLWDSGKSGSFYGTSKREIKVGDVITILVSESTNANQEASTKTSKESRVGTDILNGFNQISNLLGNDINRKTNEFSVRGTDAYNGTGQTSRKSRVTAVVTAIVTEILDNGNIFIVGEHKVKVNSEVETIHVSGIVKPSDIGPNNTVNSFQLAKAEVSINGAGSVGSKQSPGVLTKMFNWLF